MNICFRAFHVCGLALIVLLGCNLTEDSERLIDLDQFSHDRPFVAITDSFLNSESDNGLEGNFVTCDVNGDGVDEFVMSTPRGFLCFSPGKACTSRLVHWQKNLPEAVFKPDTRLRFVFAHDLNGDKCDEIVFTLRSSQQENWILYIHDSAGGGASRQFTLPNGIDKNNDGRWEGLYSAVGVIENAGGTGRLGIVLTCEVGYDVYGRGVLAIDPDSGEILWRFDVGPNPIRRISWIGDLDGDSQQEVVFGATSPNNLGGDLINGTSDNRARIFAISHLGELKWSHPVGAHFFSPRFVVGDLDRNGTLEIVVSSHHHSAGDFADTLAVLSGQTGDRLVGTETSMCYYGLAVSSPAEGEQPRIYCGSKDGHLRSYRFENNQLILERTAKSEKSVHVASVGNIIPQREGSEIVLLTDTEWDLILDEEFNTLVQFKSIFPCNLTDLNAAIWTQPDYTPEFVLSSNFAKRVYWFEASQRSILPPKPVMAIGLLGLGLIAIIVHRRKREDSALPDRDIRIGLIGRLHLISHGAFNIMGSLDELKVRFKHASENEEMCNRFGDAIRDSYNDFNKDCQSSLEEIFATAESIDFSKDVVTETEAALLQTDQILKAMSADDFSFSSIQLHYNDFITSLGQVTFGCKQLRANLDKPFTSNALETIKQLLKLSSRRFAEMKMQVHFTEALTIEGPSGRTGDCLIDSIDLRFILENLIGNACEAMKVTNEKKLAISIGETKDKIRIRVTDTGSGIPLENQKLIFSGDISSNSGTGLVRSKELLKPWNGTLKLEKSTPGEGSSFSLELTRPTKEPQRATQGTIDS